MQTCDVILLLINTIDAACLDSISPLLGLPNLASIQRHCAELFCITVPWFTQPHIRISRDGRCSHSVPTALNNAGHVIKYCSVSDWNVVLSLFPVEHPCPVFRSSLRLLHYTRYRNLIAWDDSSTFLWSSWVGRVPTGDHTHEDPGEACGLAQIRFGHVPHCESGIWCVSCRS
jgi:hypothetical protein